MHVKRWSKLSGALLAIVSVWSMGCAVAASSNVSHAYSASSALANGSLVSLDPTRTNFVTPSTNQNASHLLGVVVEPSDSLLAANAGSGNVQVATDGTASVLVSDLNGNINAGDKVGVSPFQGIGMKATLGTYVIGQAQTAFDGASSASVTQNVTDNRGKTKSLKIGYVRVSIAVSVYSASDNGTALQRLAKSLTGHQVSTLRVILSLLMALVTILVVVTLIYAAIYGSIISVGRNPLAKHAIMRSLWAVIVMVFILVGIAIATIMFLLR